MCKMQDRQETAALVAAFQARGGQVRTIAKSKRTMRKADWDRVLEARDANFNPGVFRAQRVAGA